MSPLKTTKAFLRRSLNDNARVSGKFKRHHTAAEGAVGSIASTGGTIFEPGNGYRYHFFTNDSASEDLVVSQDTTYDVFMVGGGGGGGGQRGGGGGAGGVREISNVPFDTGTFAMTVGSGGPNSPDNGRGVKGDDTTVAYTGGTHTAAGGGYGGGASGPQPGGDGGSGGGGRQSTPPGAAEPGGDGNVPSQSPPQGNPGAPGTNDGGGAGGGAGSSADGGLGGDGVSAFSADPGIPPAYGTINPGAPGRWFAGGGSGTRNTTGGGVGGGGDSNSAGTANTGGGGGGAPNPGIGKAGGSGIIILRQSVYAN
tara:strand:- start:61 stop:990 length:930 start_codon:yes stop_codon:yes gene_type:complete